MEVIAYHIERNLLCNSQGQVCLVDPLRFLDSGSTEDIRLFTNLDYCVANLFRLLRLPKEAGERILLNRKLQIIPENYELFYIPGKIFSITFGKAANAPTYTYADCSQYHDMRIVKGGYSADQAIEACKQSADTGREIMQCLGKLDITPTALISPIKCYQKAVLDKMDLPTVMDMGKAEEAAEWAYECSHRQWVEALQVGHWPMAYDYDMVSAYASELISLPDIRQGRWIHGAAKPHDAILGFLKGKVVVNHWLSPIMYEKANVEADKYYTPNGSWDCYITQAEADFIKSRGIGHFELESGWWFVPNEFGCDKPLAKIVTELHAYKEQSTGLCREVVKRIMTGIYGKTLESWSDRFGPLFNPVWGATVDTNIRLRVANFCLQAAANGCKPLHIAVDGVLLDKPIPPQFLSEGLGNWKHTGAGPLIIASSGILGLGGNLVDKDFALNYSKLRGLIETDLSASSYKMHGLSFVTLLLACQQDKWASLGEVYDLERTIDITAEHKRYYPESPSTGAELLAKSYDSQPWDSYLLEQII